MATLARVLAATCCAAALLGAAGCGSEKLEVTQKLDGPTRVEVVRHSYPRGFGILPSYAANCRLHVYGSRHLEDEVPCGDRIRLAEDEAGSLLSYRSGAKDSWLLWIGRDNLFYDCAAPLGSGARPDFARAGTLERAALRLVSCRTRAPPGAQQSLGYLLTTLGEELRRRHGVKAVSALFEATSRKPPARSGGEGVLPDEWAAAALATLRLGERETLLRGLCPAMSDAAAPAFVFLRAAALCPLEDVGRAALERLRAAFAVPAGAAGADAPEVAAAVFEMALRLALLNQPQDAGAAGCAFLAAAHRSDDFRVDGALAAISLGKVSCAAVAPMLEAAPCPESPADAPGTARSLARWLEASDGFRRHEAAAMAQSLPAKDKLLAAASFPLDRSSKAWRTRRAPGEACTSDADCCGSLRCAPSSPAGAGAASAATAPAAAQKVCATGSR